MPGLLHAQQDERGISMIGAFAGRFVQAQMRGYCENRRINSICEKGILLAESRIRLTAETGPHTGADPLPLAMI